MAHARRAGHDRRMTDFTPWLRPTIVGPFVGCYALVTFAHLAFGDRADEVLLAGLYAEHHFDSWVLSILITSFVAAALAVSLIVADVGLLRMKLRRLPTGLGAWLGGLLAPVALHFGWMTMLPGEATSMLDLALRFAIPFPMSALALRLLIGQRP
jgi:hypothetical protein